MDLIRIAGVVESAAVLIGKGGGGGLLNRDIMCQCKSDRSPAGSIVGALYHKL